MLMATFIESSGIVILGADCVTESYFVNKIGSSIALDLAGKLGRPAYIIVGKSKIISDKMYKFIADGNPDAEIAAYRNRKINIVNQYFEAVKPTGDFRYIYGDKLLRPNQIARLLRNNIVSKL